MKAYTIIIFIMALIITGAVIKALAMINYFEMFGLFLGVFVGLWLGGLIIIQFRGGVGFRPEPTFERKGYSELKIR